MAIYDRDASSRGDKPHLALRLVQSLQGQISNIRNIAILPDGRISRLFSRYSALHLYLNTDIISLQVLSCYTRSMLKWSSIAIIFGSSAYNIVYLKDIKSEKLPKTLKILIRFIALHG